MTVHHEHGDAVLLAPTVGDLVGLAEAGDVRLDYCDFGHLDAEDQWEVYRHLGCYLHAANVPEWVRVLRESVRGGAEYRVTFLPEVGSFREVVLDYGDTHPWSTLVRGEDAELAVDRMVWDRSLWDLDWLRLPTSLHDALEAVRARLIHGFRYVMRNAGLPLPLGGRVELLLYRSGTVEGDPFYGRQGIITLPNSFDHKLLPFLCARNMFPRSVLVAAEFDEFGEVVPLSREGPATLSDAPGRYEDVLVGVEGAFSRALGRPTLFDGGGGAP